MTTPAERAAATRLRNKQYKALAAALRAENERCFARAEGLPDTGIPVAYLAGRQKTFLRAIRYADRGEVDVLSREFARDIERGPYLKVGSWWPDSMQRFPLGGMVQERAAYAALNDVLALVVLHTGIEVQVKWPEKREDYQTLVYNAFEATGDAFYRDACTTLSYMDSFKNQMYRVILDALREHAIHQAVQVAKCMNTVGRLGKLPERYTALKAVAFPPLEVVA